MDRHVRHPRCDESGGLLYERAALVLGRAPKPVHKPEAARRLIADDAGARLYRARLAAYTAVADQRRALAQAVGEASGGGPAYRIDADTDRRSVVRLDDPFRRVPAVDEDDAAGSVDAVNPWG